MDDAREPRELELRDYVTVIRRRKGTIAATTLVVVVVALGLSLVQRSTYQATAEVLLQQRTSERIFPAGQQQNATPDAARVATEIQVMQSRSVEDAVTQALGRKVTVDIAARGQTDVVAISAQDNNPDEAARIAQTYADTYVTIRRDQTVNDLLQASTQIQQQIDKINGQIAALNAPVSSLNTQINGVDNAAERNRLSAQRDQLVAQNATQTQALQARINSYTTQLENLQVASNLTQTGGAQIVSKAQVPTSPISPTPKRDGAIALFVGLLLGVGLAFLREYLDDTIKSKEDLDAALGGLAVLSLVPQVEGWKDRAESFVVTIDQPSSPAAEAYRTLRTSVQFVGLDRPMKLIQVTSPAASEGKTTTLSNLAVALARAGKRVVMADCDLRRPRVESFFGVTNDCGFTDVVVGEASLAQSIKRVASDPRLAILPAGPPPPNPTELLSAKRSSDLLHVLSEEADYVLVDSPPVLPVADAVIIAGMVDATILVITANSTTKRQSQRALELLQQVDAPIIGVVLNGVEPDGGGYSYGGSYAYYGGAAPSRRGWFGRRQGHAASATAGPHDQSDASLPVG